MPFAHRPAALAGPGIARGELSCARVGLHELAPTLLEIVGCESIGAPDSRSFGPALRDPLGAESAFATSYAEYHGGRYRLTQRVYWDGPWKLVRNGFDIDELYNLEDDPYELTNLAEAPAHAERLRTLMAGPWRRAQETGDHPLVNTHYPILRVAPFGPLVADDSEG